MSSRRALKAAQAIREVVSSAILLELKDPRVRDVTVTLVEVSGDLRNARVYVSVMGDEKKQNLCLHGLSNASGFLQKRVGARIDTRYTPRLSFVLDKGAKNALEVTRILREVLPEEADDLPPETPSGPFPDAAETGLSAAADISTAAPDNAVDRSSVDRSSDDRSSVDRSPD